MKFGFDPRCPTLGTNHEHFIRVVTEGEALGYDYTTISDHLVIPRTVTADYPYTRTGKMMSEATGPRHEQLTAIAFLAAKTQRLRFLTSVMVVPFRPALLTAKVISTIDVLSGGRIDVGVGTGWMSDEFVAVGAPDFSKRGKVTDEYIRAFKSLWTEENPHFDGEFVRFSDLEFEPKPVQKPHPPIWVGGVSAPAMRRAARLGDAWYPVTTGREDPLDSLPRMRAGIATLRELTEAAGRPRDSLGISLRVHKWGKALDPVASDGARQLLSGSADEIIADLEQLRALGLNAIDIRFTEGSLDEVLSSMDWFQKNVIARVRR